MKMISALFIFYTFASLLLVALLFAEHVAAAGLELVVEAFAVVVALAVEIFAVLEAASILAVFAVLEDASIFGFFVAMTVELEVAILFYFLINL